MSDNQYYKEICQDCNAVVAETYSPDAAKTILIRYGFCAVCAGKLAGVAGRASLEAENAELKEVVVSLTDELARRTAEYREMGY